MAKKRRLRKTGVINPQPAQKPVQLEETPPGSLQWKPESKPAIKKAPAKKAAAKPKRRTSAKKKVEKKKEK